MLSVFLGFYVGASPCAPPCAPHPDPGYMDPCNSPHRSCHARRGLGGQLVEVRHRLVRISPSRCHDSQSTMTFNASGHFLGLGMTSLRRRLGLVVLPQRRTPGVSIRHTRYTATRRCVEFGKALHALSVLSWFWAASVLVKFGCLARP